MRPFIKAAVAAACLALSAPALAQAPGPTPPSYYPQDYTAIVEGSKKENKLVVYSIMAEYNWKPVLEGFKKLYPWIDVQTLDLGSSEVFERYYAERGSNAQSADLLINGAVDKWLQFAARNEILDYKSPETEKLPKWSLPRPGIYTVSADPMVIVYNKALVPEKMQPKSMQDLADLATKNAGQFKGKITSYNASVEAFGLAINWAYAKKKGDVAWQNLEAIGKVARMERSAGPMVEKLTTGEYAIGYWISGIVFFPKLDDPARARLLGWTLPADGTPIVLRGMAIPKGSTNVNSAKLMLDYILSHDGQVGFGKGGLTPYREDVKENEVPRFTFQKIAREVGGEDKLVIVEYDEDILTKGPEFQARWRKAFGL